MCGFIMRNAAAERDRADMDVAIVDVPAVVAGIGGAAAAECGHAPMIPQIWPVVKPLQLGP
jgi:hypothetical protein